MRRLVTFDRASGSVIGRYKYIGPGAFSQGPGLPAPGPASSGSMVAIPVRSDIVDAIQSELAAVRSRLSQLEAALTQASALSVTLATLDAPGLHLRFPIDVELHVADDGAVAQLRDLELYGSGESDYEAMADLRRHIVDAFRDLSREQRLGPLPQSQLNRLRELVEEVPVP